MSDLDFYDLDSIDPCFDFNQDNENEADQAALDLKDYNEGLCGDSNEYKRIRKRRQNRESAARARARKKINVTQVSEEITLLESLKEKLDIENAKLKAENDLLKKELEFYKGMITNN